jgi:hypothetical protein
MRLRDMGIKPKDLIKACQEAGINMSSKRSSEIINGQSFINPNEMEVIAKMLNRTVDKLYMELGSVLEVICPILTIGKQDVICVRQRCAWWDWEHQVCSVRSITLR